MAGSDLFTGSLDLLLLKAVSWGPRHGYAIGQWLKQTTSEVIVVQEGALYPALHRLERQGLLEEEWGVSETGRKAKFYRLTPAGRRHLKQELARWSEFSRVMTLSLAAERP
ncbi:MAG: PadR family transcriptional regulator [Gemmatimonadales bacterium]